MIGEEFEWAQKYRPRTVEDCILPKALKTLFRNFIAQGELPHFMFTGRPGTGKTTVARAICEDIGSDVLFINASLASGIDTLRTTVAEFAATVSMTDSIKTVILDEADNLNASSTQLAMRGFMEQFSSNCRFILTCNYPSKIISGIESRCTTVDFTIPNEEKADISIAFMKRAMEILRKENVEFDVKAVAELIKRHYPDFRKTLGQLQRYSSSGKIDSGILIGTSNEAYKDLFGLLKGKKFNDVRKWVAANSADPASLFNELYNICSFNLTDESVPQMILFLADYQYKSAFVADQEINTMACLTEIMSECKFK